MFGALLQLGGIGFSVFGALEEGKEERKRLEWEIEQRRKRASHLTSMAVEKLHDLAVEKSYARGAAKAGQAAAGVKVGTGSALTLLNKIEGAYRRKAELITKKTGHETAMLALESQELESRKKKAKKSSIWKAGTSLLTGGYDFGKSMEWWG